MGGKVELGDFFRHTVVNESFILVLGQWKGNKRSLISTQFFFIDSVKWRNLFLCSPELVVAIRTGLQHITNLKCDDQLWRQMTTQWHQEFGINRPVRLAPKRDHKTQRRIQCSITLDHLLTFPHTSELTPQLCRIYLS